MTSIPDGVYRINSAEFGCATMILPEQNVLRGEEGTGMRWTARCQDQYQGLYTFESVDFGGYLGVNSLSNNQAVYRLDNSEAQQWRVQQNMNGLSISQASEGINYFWYLGAVGEPVIIMDNSKKVQSWTFEVAE